MTDGAVEPVRRYRTSRVEAFSDGVFAIAITLLVLEIRVPADAEANLLAAVLDQWPSYLAYVVSFATIGAAWLGHTAITEYLEHVDATFLRLNLLLLLVVAFIPFPTSLLAEHISLEDAERVASTLYGINLMLAALLIAALWRYAVRVRLVHPDMDDEKLQLLTERLTPGIGGYVVLIVVGLVVPIVAVVGYLLVALFFLLPFPVRGRRTRRARGRGLGRVD